VLNTGEADVLALISYRLPSDTGTGAERFWSATHTPLLDDRGQVSFVLQHTVDVTELEQLKRAARAPAALSDVSRAQMEAGVLGRARRMQDTNLSLDAERRALRRLVERQQRQEEERAALSHKYAKKMNAHGICHENAKTRKKSYCTFFVLSCFRGYACL
jgi:hypothetical protein